MKQVLFICVGNSCRSQMAEAVFNHHAPRGWKAISAGTKPASRVHPLALRVLAELGIDHSDGRPKLLTDGMAEQADRVVAVCSESEACPVVPPGKKMAHWGIPDPYSPVEDRFLPQYREARDLIKTKVLQLIGELNDEK